MMTDDRGLAALAEAIIETPRTDSYLPDANPESVVPWATAILGERAVFWPTGTEEYRELIHQYQAEIARLRREHR